MTVLADVTGDEDLADLSEEQREILRAVPSLFEVCRELGDEPVTLKRRGARVKVTPDLALLKHGKRWLRFELTITTFEPAETAVSSRSDQSIDHNKED